MTNFEKKPVNTMVRKRSRIINACREECEPLFQLKLSIVRQHQTIKIVWKDKTAPLTPLGIERLNDDSPPFEIIEEMRNAPAKLMVDRIDAQIEEILKRYQFIAEKELAG